MLARAEALGWSQNELARRADRNPGHLSAALNGKVTAGPTWLAAERAIEREERRRRRKSEASDAA